MRNLLRQIVIIVVVPMIFVGVLFAHKSVVVIAFSNSVALTEEVSSPSPTPVSLLDKVALAKQLLKKSKPLRFEERKVGRTSKELVRKQIALAILDKNTGEIFEWRVWVRESEIKVYKRIGSINLEPAVKDEPLAIRAVWWNSFNTQYEISGHSNLIVLANKYLFPSASVPYPQERSKTKYSEIIYAPYSEALHSPELIDAGREHINKMVDSAFESLRLRAVASYSTPGKLVTDVVNKDFIKNIITVEHVDPDAFQSATDGGKLLTERVMAIVGANDGYAYSYTGSPAGASGIAQFIKSTYLNTRRKYPSAGLISDFRLGMADHTNAFKAMVLFFDSHKQDIENKVTRKDVLMQLGGGITEEMLALAYNGGPSKVIRSVNSYGLAWISGQLNLSRPAIFKQETLSYFNKFKAIKNLNIF